MKNKLLISIIMMLISGIIGSVLFNIMPKYHFSLYPLIPLLFLVILTVSYYTFSYYINKKNSRAMLVYSVIKVIKFILCLAIILLYTRIINNNNIAFGITFMSFYFISLTIESWLFYKIIKGAK